MKSVYSQPKRVLMFFSSSYEGQYARDLARGFQDAKIEIGFVSLSGTPKPNWLNGEFMVDLSNNFRADSSLVRKVLNSISVVREFKPDVIQTHLFYGGIVGLIVGKLFRIPVVHTRHHIDEHYQSGTIFHRLLDRLTARYSNHIVVCSHAAKKWLVEVEGQEVSQITVINQGFDFDSLKPTPESVAKCKLDLGFSKSKLNIICVARYSKSKGQNYLIMAIYELVKTIPNITLTLMGPGDSAWLLKLVSELGLEHNVRILPARTDVTACIAAADLIIHPSLADSFSQLLIEAQAAGGLLIASDIAAAREQVIDGVTGTVVPPRDSNAIVEAVQYLIRNPELAESMRRSGPEHVREKFTWQRMVREEIECLSMFV
jgi:glycosyltransferase involved in cell wall biosynthesis